MLFKLIAQLELHRGTWEHTSTEWDFVQHAGQKLIARETVKCVYACVRLINHVSLKRFGSPFIMIIFYSAPKSTRMGYIMVISKCPYNYSNLAPIKINKSECSHGNI